MPSIARLRTLLIAVLAVVGLRAAAYTVPIYVENASLVTVVTANGQ